MPRTLVTGASGFIGRRMVRHFLAEGLAVSVLVRTDEQADPFRAQGCETHIGDLTIPSTLTKIGEGIEQVIHLAANTTLQAREEADLSVNVEGTRNLLEALNEFQALKRFVLMSSIAAVARERGSRLSKPLDATSEAIPDTAYGRSKRKAEELVVQAFEGSPVDWTILRPALVYGPGSKPAGGMNALVELATRPGLVGRLNFPGQISVLHVDDLINVCLLVTRSEFASRRAIFVTDGEPVTFGQIIRTASEILGVSRRLAPVSYACAVARSLYDALDAAIGLSKWVPSYVLAPFGFSLACVSGDLQDLGYSPRYSLRSGLTQTLRNET